MLKIARKVRLLKMVSAEAESFDMLSDTEVMGARQEQKGPEYVHVTLFVFGASHRNAPFIMSAGI